MAYCRFISKIQNIESQAKAIGYNKNKNKTLNPSYAQSKALNYIANEDKTRNEQWLKFLFAHKDEDTTDEKEFFVTGIMCNKENAHQRMLEAQNMSNKPIVNYAYHAIQSFEEGPGEMSPETAHEIGVRLMKELWGNEFMILIATHLNTNHYHNHFVICSTSPITGKRFHECPEAWRAMANKSDELCKEYGLKTLDHAPMRTRSKSKGEVAMKRKGIPTHHDLLKRDCDIAIHKSHNWNDFINCLRAMGYTVHRSNTFINLQAEGWKRPIRIYYDKDNNKSLGTEYTKPRIEERIAEHLKQNSEPSVTENIDDNPPVFNSDEEEFDYYYEREQQKKSNKKFKGSFAKTEDDYEKVNVNPNVRTYKFKGRVRAVKRGIPADISITYYRLSYKLCIAPMPCNKKRKRRMTVYMRKEVNKLHKYLDQVSFFANTGIKSISGLNLYKEYASSQMNELCDERKVLRNKLRCCKNRSDEIQVRNDISKLTKEIAVLRKRISMCDDIIENSDNVKATVDTDSLNEMNRYKENRKKERGDYEQEFYQEKNNDNKRKE